MTNIEIPLDLWEEEQTGVIAAWIYDDGDIVEEGAIIAQVMVEKVQFDIAAPASGLLRIQVQEEVEIRQGDVIGTVLDD